MPWAVDAAVNMNRRLAAALVCCRSISMHDTSVGCRQCLLLAMVGRGQVKHIGINEIFVWYTFEVDFEGVFDHMQSMFSATQIETVVKHVP